jgi:hypothetical protein
MTRNSLLLDGERIPNLTLSKFDQQLKTKKSKRAIKTVSCKQVRFKHWLYKQQSSAFSLIEIFGKRLGN